MLIPGSDLPGKYEIHEEMKFREELKFREEVKFLEIINFQGKCEVPGNVKFQK